MDPNVGGPYICNKACLENSLCKEFFIKSDFTECHLYKKGCPGIALNEWHWYTPTDSTFPSQEVGTCTHQPSFNADEVVRN